MEILEDYAQFTTITALDWKPLLNDDEGKNIIINSLKYMVENKRIYVYAFVLMSNHLHLIWQMRPSHLLKDVQRDFLKFTAQQLKFSIQKKDPEYLNELEVNLNDRKYQFWQRNSLSIPLSSPNVFEQKIDYIHQNPIKAGLAETPWQ